MESSKFEETLLRVRAKKNEIVELDLSHERLNVEQLELLKTSVREYNFVGEILFTERVEQIDENRLIREIRVCVTENTIKFIDSHVDYSRDHKKQVEYRLKLLSLKQTTDQDSFQIADLLNMIASSYNLSGEFKLSLEYFQRSLEMRKRLYKGELVHGDVASAMRSVGLAHINLGEYQKGLENCSEAVGLYKKLLDSNGSENSVELALSLYCTGLAHTCLNQWPQGKEFHLKSLKMYQAIYNKDHVEIVKVLTALSTCERNEAHFEAALEYEKQAYDMKKRLVDGKDHKDLVKRLASVASLYEKLKDYDNAIGYQTQAVDMAKRIEDNKLWSGSVELLGDIQSRFKKSAKAIECYNLCMESKDLSDRSIERVLKKIYQTYKSNLEFKKALDYCHKGYDKAKTIYSENSQEILEYLNNLGILYGNMNEYAKSVEYYKQALAKSRVIFKDRPEYTNVFLTNISLMFVYLGDFKSALEYQLELLDNMKKTEVNKDSSESALLLLNIGVSYDKSDQADKALEFKLKSWETSERISKGDGEEKVKILMSLAETCAKIDSKKAKSLEYRLEGLEMQQRLLEKAGGDKEHEKLEVMYNIGDVYNQQGKTDKAIEIYLNIVDRVKKILDKEPSKYESLREYIKKCVVAMIQCYQKMNDDQNVKIYQAELDKVKNKTSSKACVIS